MKKVFDQTVRDIKREVNKKVLKVPGIEQKVLDATSNEPWGPHGTLLADIAQASRNYHEYQMIMGVIWKRINDTGKNWRHVYKALTVLEYLVAHGSERIIDDIREHAYQISTLSEFQYIDSSGRDQGSNVRRKSQTLVVLVNDKERIVEVRQKAAANRDKFRTTSVGGMYRPSSYSSVGGNDDDRYEGRYGSRDEDRNGYGYGREREYNYNDDRYGRYGDSYNREGDRYGKDYEDRYSRDGYRDDEYQGRSRSIDDYGSRGRSSDRERGFDDDGQSSSRGSGARADDQSQDGSIARRLERKFSEQNIAPPNYEEAVNESQSPARSERETTAASVPGASSPPAPKAASSPAPGAASPSAINAPSQTTNAFGTFVPPAGQEVEVADEFDPRGPGSAGPTTTSAPAAIIPNNAEMDLLGSLSDSFTAHPLAIMPVDSAAATSKADVTNFSGSTFAATQPAANIVHQPFQNPFGDSAFEAIPSTGDTISAQQQSSASATTFQPTVNQNTEMPTISPQETANNFDFGDTPAVTYSAPTVQPTSANSQFVSRELSTSHQEIDILADILPPSGPSPAGGFSAMAGQPAEPGPNVYGNYNSQAGFMPPIGPNVIPQAAQFSSGNFLPHGGSAAPISSNVAPQTPAGPGTQLSNGNLFPQQAYAAPGVIPAAHHITPGPTPQFNGGNFLPHQESVTSAAQLAATGPTPQFNNAQYVSQQGSTAPVVSQAEHHTASGPTPQFNTGNFLPQNGSAPAVSNTAPQTAITPTSQFNNGNVLSQHGSAQHNSDVLGNLFSQKPNTSMSSQPAVPSSTGSLATVPQQSKDKFETKSTVWADTLSRGLVNLNISGPKTNPLADIGVDFDAINRKEKRMEKHPITAPISTVTMGKAMGSGSGIGRAGASALRAPPNSMVSPGMGMGAGMNMGMGTGGGPGSGMGMVGGPGSGMGMGMGGYGGMNQPMGMGMGMNMSMNRPMGMGMGMNMGMGQGGPMQPPGSTMPGGYNPMMGAGGYAQQPYGGGYR